MFWLLNLKFYLGRANSMLKIYIPIDSKSLFYNIFNDNKSGHTPTVCTPIQQGKSVHKEVEQIFKIPKQVDFYADDLLNDYLNKSSKSTTRVTNVFLFNNITVNGIKVEISDHFCMFVKEEVDQSKIQFGRIKLHYPLTIKYSGLYTFDNKHVINKISEKLKNYSFVVRGFYYDFENDVLDFDVDIVGYNLIPYSKVFITNKGTGNKYVQDCHDTFDNYDVECIALKNHFGYENVSPANYLEILNEMRQISFDLLKMKLDKNNVIFISKTYPYALFDINYEENGVKRYGIISSSATKDCYFNFSIRQWQFINDFCEYVDFYSITEIYGKRKIIKFTYDEILEMNSSIKAMSFKK